MRTPQSASGSQGSVQIRFNTGFLPPWAQDPSLLHRTGSWVARITDFTVYSAFATITQSIVADIAHAQHATRSSRMENQAASAGSAARQRTTVLLSRTSTVGKIAVGSSSQRGLTTRPSRDSRKHPNAAHLSHLQEATSISHPTSSSGVYFTFGTSCPLYTSDATDD